MLFKQILAFRPGRMELTFALKTFIAGMLALFVSFRLDLINPMWSIGTVMIIASPFSGMVSSKCVYRLIGTVAGAIIALLLTPPLINTPWLFSVVLALWVGFALYISLLDRTPRSYVFMLAGYSTAMIVCNAIGYIDSYNIFDLALARVLEISIGVIAHAVVSATVLPIHIGSVIRQRVTKLLNDTEKLFSNLLKNPHPDQNYSELLAGITRDSSDIHALAVHLSYEKGELQGMTKQLQEMLHQMSMVIANLVAMSEKREQLHQLDFKKTEYLEKLQQHVLNFLNQKQPVAESQLTELPAEFEADFNELLRDVNPEQYIVLSSIKMDIRHFIHNIRTVKLLWGLIQAGEKNIPESITPITTTYPSLHRDYGVAVRGGVSAFLITLIVCALWILSGWRMGFMMAQMGAVTACILTALDNPVPVLRIFIWGSLVSAGLVFVYAFGIFPHITAFWELALVLLPMFLFSVSMMANPSLMPVGMVLGINTMMGLNLRNSYNMDAVTYFDSSFAMILGVLVSLIVIYFVRAMSPETSATRILALHSKAMRQALVLPYGTQFRIHLRSMLDRIGVLNTKMVQSSEIRSSINAALVECSAIVDLSRLQELAGQLSDHELLVKQIVQLGQQLEHYFELREQAGLWNAVPSTELIRQLQELRLLATNVEDNELRLRLLISLNNIQCSICHIGMSNTQPHFNMAGA